MENADWFHLNLNRSGVAVGRGRLIIICGLPGTGKTTLSARLAEKLGARRYDPDEWMTSLSLDLYDAPRRASDAEELALLDPMPEDLVK